MIKNDFNVKTVRAYAQNSKQLKIKNLITKLKHKILVAAKNNDNTIWHQQELALSQEEKNSLMKYFVNKGFNILIEDCDIYGELDTLPHTEGVNIEISW